MPSGSGLVRAVSACRGCKGGRLERVLSLGEQPPANAFLRADQLKDPEPRFPLDVDLCRGCALLQLRHSVSPELLFRNYLYNSSTSPVFVQHFRDMADELSPRFGLGPGSLVVDVGSNDGILLRPFQAKGARVLGVDPAENIARMATEGGVETWPRFFNPETAREVVARKGKADLVTATNVFAHVDDLDGVVEGVKALLGPRGAFMVEVAYVADFVEKSLFDTVYHEHLFYWGVKPIEAYFRRHGMEVFDVTRVPTHGGSIRVFAQPAGGPHRREPSVDALLAEEARKGLHDVATYHAFAKRVEENRRALRTLLADLKSQGKRIAGYGAPAKGSTLLNYFGLGTETLDYVVDDAPLKQGLHVPGVHVPIVPASALESRRPDFVLLLAWNFAEPIMRKLSAYRESGGRFIMPVPEPHVIP